jgi:membrane protein YqaA with SNARE-associated domain
LALAFALVISISVFAIGNRIDPEQFQRYGYPGVFLISLLGNATIILPAPSLAVVSMTGAFLNPFLVGLVAGFGESLGELTGYLAGYSGQAVIENREKYDRIVTWTQSYGLWVIFILSVIPNPLFDLAGIAAGALRVPLYKFLIVCWVGKTIKTTLFALGGKAVLFPFLS